MTPPKSNSAKPERILIRNVVVVNTDGRQHASVLIAGNKITAVGEVSGDDFDEVVDGDGKYLLPGIVDDQVHFREPGLTHKEDLRHASRACAKGGITSFLEMPNTKPSTTTCDRLHEKLELARHSSLVNYGFYIGATVDNLRELKQAQRTPGIKIFIGSSTGDLLVDDQQALERIFGDTDLPICAHCEDESTTQANARRLAGSTDVADHSRVRDHRAAWIATKRAIDLAHRHRHCFHVLHLSTAAEIELLSDHRNLITAEVCPHHLLFNVDDYARLGSLIKMNPSVKTREDNEGLWDGLLAGKIQVIATDHSPHTLDEKKLPYPECPSGMPCVENSLSLMLNEVNRGRFSLEQLVSWMCDAPARIWNMVNKGRICVGYDADLVLVDLNQTRVIDNRDQQTKCRWSAWHGVKVAGIPVRTWVQGRCVYQWTPESEWFADHPAGQEIQFHSSRTGFWANRD